MSYNGSGVFNINTAGQPVVTGTVISSTAFNALTADLATGLTTALTKDGQTTPTANIKLGGFKLTGVGVATTSGDALSYGQAATVSTLTNSALTSGRVPYASTAGLLTDSANLLYSGTDLTVYGLTVGRGAGAIASNTVVGYQAALNNTSGANNVAFGNTAFYANSTGSQNVAIGGAALQANTTASSNTAVGYQAGYSNTTAPYCVFLGSTAGYSNTTGAANVCIGNGAGYSSVTSTSNVIIGSGVYGSTNGAGYATTSGLNTFIGAGAGSSVTTGGKNTILGNYTGNQGGLDIRTASNYIVLSDGDGNPRQVIDSSGNLLVGTTSGTENRLYKSSSTYSTRIENTSTSTGSTLLLQSGRAAGTGFTNIECYANGALNFQVLGNGNVQNTNNSYGAISDVKLKENIVDALPKLAEMMQVKVRNYNLIGETTKQLGVVAQELETVFPNMIDETPDYEDVITTDEDGKETTERVLTGTKTKSVKYSVFVPMLIKAMQEQQAIIESLNARLTALESK
jgi:hypothetical protein